jgi:Fungal protein kinase
VSIGNILSYNGAAKLADLEYAKKVGDTKTHDMRTASRWISIHLSNKSLTVHRQGTMHFMSIEVAAHMFLFLPQQSTESTEFQDKLTSIHEKRLTNSKLAKVLFTHNHLHDLESLWWVAVWLVFYNHFRDTQQSNEEPLSDLQDVERQLGLARILFPASIESFRRRDGFQQLFPEICNDLPSNKHTIGSYLDLLRSNLVTHYSKVETTLPQSIDLSASEDDIYDRFRQVFTYSGELNYTLTFIPDIHTQLRGNLKRARAVSTNDVGGATQKKR